MSQAPVASHDGLSRIDVAQIRVRLLAMRAELEARRSERDLIHLKKIEAALEKTSRGGYGICEACARPIVKARLLEAPHVRYCAVCSNVGARVAPASRARTKLFA